MFTKKFSQLKMSDVAAAGGKGASLGEMISAGIPVPPGFVILSSAFDMILEQNGLSAQIDNILRGLDYDDVGSVNQASSQIRDLILHAGLPDGMNEELQREFREMNCDFVAVRSSATAEDSKSASWAGELESYLNTREKNFIDNVRKCWSSLFTPRAIFYRRENDLQNTKVSVAVVVQEMIESDVSGICFTVHPVTKNKSEMIIEAGYGLGEAIVSGSITPDAYVVDKNNRQIIDINISTQEKQIVRCLRRGAKWADVSAGKIAKQKLSDKQILDLSKICAKIEDHYVHPCDIEWAIKGGEFFIVQSRPITTL